MTAQDIIAHLHENAIGYGIVLVCLLPIIYGTRKYSVPIIIYLVEFTIYAVSVHVFTWLLVNVTRWFKEKSSMRALQPDGRPIGAPNWSTPLLEFWHKDAYNPQWIWIVEAVALVIIFLLMWRYRPMKIQRKPKRATQEFGKKTARSGNTGKPAARGVRGKGKSAGVRRGR